MRKRFIAMREDVPGSDWRARFVAGRAEAEAWYLNGRAPPPSAAECAAQIRRHMPELLSLYESELPVDTLVRPRSDRQGPTTVGRMSGRDERRRLGRERDVRWHSGARRGLFDHPDGTVRAGDLRSRVRCSPCAVPDSRGAIAERDGSRQDGDLRHGLLDARSRSFGVARAGLRQPSGSDRLGGSHARALAIA